MSGSLKFLPYDTDDGLLWAMLTDESNFENVNTDGLDITITDLAARRYKVPSNVEKRFATFKSTTTVRQKKVYLPTRAHYDDIQTNGATITVRTFTDADTGEAFQFVSATPERISPVVIDGDTGLDDGDAS